MRTPSGAASAAACGVLPLLLDGIMDNNAVVRFSYYRTLLDSVQHEQQRQEVADITVTCSKPEFQQLLLNAHPARRFEMEAGSDLPAVAYILACAIAETNTYREKPDLHEPGCCVALPLQLLEKIAQVLIATSGAVLELFQVLLHMHQE